MKKKPTNKKGFTLIELLAVIIILGILMIIAIPSVTEYINNSRKSAFLDSGSGYISSVRNKVNALKEFKFTDPAVAYFVQVSNVKADSCVNLEKGGNSPFGDWDKAYVIVTTDGNTGYSYYFAARDESGYGLAPTKEEDFDNDNLKAGQSLADVKLAGLTDGGPLLASTLPGDSTVRTVVLVEPATNCTNVTP